MVTEVHGVGFTCADQDTCTPMYHIRMCMCMMDMELSWEHVHVHEHVCYKACKYDGPDDAHTDMAWAMCWHAMLACMHGCMGALTTAQVLMGS